MELSENCAETRPSYGSAPIWKGTAPLCMGAGEVSGGALCKSWSQSRRLLSTVQSREAKTEIPAKISPKRPRALYFNDKWSYWDLAGPRCQMPSGVW